VQGGCLLPSSLSTRPLPNLVMRTLYFSYGSNLSSRRLLSRAPGARFVTVALLKGYHLRFHKAGRDGSAKCDIEVSDDPFAKVWGAVYSITRQDILGLDKVEGRGDGYEQREINLCAPTGGAICAFTYIATRIDSALLPYHWYKEHVVRGATEFSLPDRYINQIAATPSLPDPDVERHFYELAIYLQETHTE